MFGLDTSKTEFVSLSESLLNPGEEAEIVKDALEFRKGSFSLPFTKLVVCYFKIVWETLKMTPFLTVVTVMDTSGQIFLNFRGRTLELAGLGMFLLLHHMFVSILIYSGNEKMGIELSNAYGGKTYKKCRSIFGKGIITMILAYAVFSLPIMFNIGHVMRAIGIKNELPDQVQTISRQTTGMYTLQMVNALIQTFCMAQGHEHFFGIVGLINMALAVPGNYFTIYYLDMGVTGYAIVRTSTELITLCMGIFVYSRTQKETQGLASWSETTKGFLKYLIESIKFTLGSYAYGLGIEVAGYFIALTQDTNQIGAYLCMLNFAGYLFTIAVAFSVICRTRINILIGMGQQKAAKNYFGFFIFCIMVFTVKGTALLIGTRKYTAALFTSSSPDMQSWMEQLIICYGLILSLEMTYHTSALGMKTIGRVNLLLLVAAVLIIGVNIAGSYGLKTINANVVHYFLYSMGLCGCITIFAILVTLNSDWKDLKNKNTSMMEASHLIVYEARAEDEETSRPDNILSLRHKVYDIPPADEDPPISLNYKPLGSRFSAYQSSVGELSREIYQQPVSLKGK